MITVGRIGSQSSDDRTTMLYLKSTDTKPLDVENASSIYEIDTGIVYNGKSKMLQEIRVVAWNKLIKTEILKKTKIRVRNLALLPQ